MLSGVHSARDHGAQRADVRDRGPSVTYNEPRGQYSDVTGQRGDVTGQYKEMYYPEVTSRNPYRGQTTPPGMAMPPWNTVPSQSSFHCCSVTVRSVYRVAQKVRLLLCL